MSTIGEARAAIDDVKRRLEAARDLLTRGASIDISPLEPALITLARAIAGLPRETAQELKNELLSLYSELDRFGTELSAAHEALARQLKGLSLGARVTSAYGKRPGGKS